MKTADRRQALMGTGLALLGSALRPPPLFAQADVYHAPFSPAAGPRSRVIVVNDLSGDIDGLFATVHALMSPTAQVRAIVATAAELQRETAKASAVLANEIVDLMNLRAQVAVFEGATARLAKPGMPVRSPGTQAIIDEALRDDPLPLYITVGGGLTEVASAIMLEPRIASRFTLVWIGGDDYPAGATGETNFNIDRLAAQFLFNETQTPIWQVPRSVYASCVVSAAELQAFVAPCGAIGDWLYRKVVDQPARFRNMLNMGETWTLGDSPLVVLTALNDWNPSGRERPFKFEKTGSSRFDVVPTPRFNPDGTFALTKDGRPMRAYRTIDTRLMFNDFFAKLRVRYSARL